MIEQHNCATQKWENTGLKGADGWATLMKHGWQFLGVQNDHEVVMNKKNLAIGLFRETKGGLRTRHPKWEVE